MNIKKTAVITAIAGVVLGASFAAAQVTTTSSCYQFERNLRVGNTGADVKALQQTLNANGFTVAAAGHAGSAGMETSYFGNATKNALIKWQEANAATTLAPWGLTSGTGFFGATSRAEMNKCAPGTPTTPGTGTVSGAVSVSLASVQPNTVLVSGSARATLGNFVFTGNGVVTSVKLQRSGISDSDTLGNIYLYDTVSGQRLTDAASAAADGTVTINNGLGLFTVAGSKSVSVMADVNTGKGGQSVGVSLIGYTVAGNPAAVVSGVNGPNLPIGTATLATVKGVATQVTGGNLAAPVQNRVLWKTDLNVQTRTVNLSSVTLKMVGSAPVASIANAGLYLDGVRIATATAGAENRFYFNPGVKYPLTTGNHTVELRADVLSGASRSFNFILENASDIVLEDSYLMNTYITLENFTNIRTAGTFSITGVTSASTGVSLYKDSTYSVSSVPAGQLNLAIAKYKMYGLGEDVKITEIKIDPKAVNASTTASSTIATSTLQNVSLVVSGGDYGNGTQVGSTNNKGTDYVYTLNSQLILRSGVTYTLEVKADLIDKASGLQLLAGTVSSDITGFTAEGLYSYNVATSSGTTGQSITIGSTDVNLAKKIGGVNTTASKNQADVKIGSFQFQVGSVEDVNITQMLVDLGGSWNANQIARLRVSNSNDVVTTAYPTNNYFYPSNTTVAKNSVITIDVIADLNEISNNATITPTLKMSYTGVTSNTRATKEATGDEVKISQVSVASPVVVAGNMPSQYIIGGADHQLGSYKFVATNGSPKITEAVFEITGNVAQSISFAGGNATVVGTTATLTGLNYVIPQGTMGVNIPVVVKYAPVSTTGGAASGATTTVTLKSFKYDGGNGVVSSATLSASLNEMTLVASKPVIVVSNYNGGLAGGNQKLVEFTVKPETASIRLDEIKFNVSLSSSGTATTSAYELYVGGSKLSNATSTVGTNVVTFELPDNYEFTNQQTIALYATVSGTLGSAGASSITTSLDAAGFMWTDTAGGATSPENGSLINGFPTNSWTLRN